MNRKTDNSFNSRKYQGQVERELIAGGIVITLVGGGGLIALIWGREAFLMALAAFGGVGLLIGLIWGFLKVIEWLSRD